MARLVDRGALGNRIAADAEQAEQGVAGRHHQRVVLGHQQIFQHRHAAEQADVLEGARDPRALRDQIFGHALEQKKFAVRAAQAAVAAAGQGLEFAPGGGGAVDQGEPSLGRLVEAGDAVEHGRLAGAVRPDQCDDAAALDGKTDILDGAQPAKMLGDAVDLEERGLAHGFLANPNRSAMNGHSPRGWAMTTMARMRP